MKPAQRLAALKPSPIRILSEGAPADAIPLGLGEPTWDLPEPARRALADLPGPCAYGPNAGLPELRRAIAAFHGADAAEVLVTSGSEGALFSLFHGWVNPGDTALVPDPGFPAYAALARLCGADVVTYANGAAHSWRLDAGAFTAALDAHPRVRIAIINHPCNPTGGGASAADLRRVAELCAARDVLLVSDEVYRDLYFEARPPSLRDVATTGAVVSSVSKGFGAPGLRVGWVVADPAWLAPARLIHGYAVTSASLPSQRAALALIEAADVVLAGGRRELSLRFDALDSAMRAHMGRPAPRPDGAFYAWLTLPVSAHADPLAFCTRLRDTARVVTVPGLVFGEAGRAHLRVSFAAPPAQINEGVRRLAAAWNDR